MRGYRNAPVACCIVNKELNFKTILSLQADGLLFCIYEKRGEAMKEVLSVGMIGGGQMGEALIRGMIESELLPPANITVAEPMGRRREYLEDTYNVKGVESPAELVGNSQTLILSIKPQIMEPVLRQYSTYLTEKHLLISIAAGIPLACMENFVGENHRIIRVMPNTPALVLAGASAM
ncbi:MAG: hypothetical protein D3916_12900, partial [Candidatus Electrothrix sp. MAN1_4]|nr:hypothetical protein [Candidatus Electrothrix sp. MAN1_4]